MLSKSIKYTDYNGVEREEKFLFNLSKAELMEMEMGTAGGLAESIRHIIETQDGGLIMKTFKDLILKAYGEKSADGNDAGVPLSVAFSQTEAYSELFMELATDSMAAAKFVEGIVPNDIDLSNVELPDDLKTPEMEAALNQMKQDKVIPIPTDK